MAKIDVYKQSGEKSGSMNLPAEVFDIEPKKELIHQALATLLANSRKPLAHTKIRSEVRGGGAKPWQQKGTGRARAGSRRSPIWIGGGTVFGPRKDKDYSKKMNVKARRKALFMVLTAKLQDKKIVVVDDIKLKEPKTKEMDQVVGKLPMDYATTLLALPGKDTDKKIRQAGRNIFSLSITRADSLNVKNLLDNEYLLLTKDSVKVIVNTFVGKKETATKAKAEVKKVAKPKAKSESKSKTTKK